MLHKIESLKDLGSSSVFIPVSYSLPCVEQSQAAAPSLRGFTLSGKRSDRTGQIIEVHLFLAPDASDVKGLKDLDSSY